MLRFVPFFSSLVAGIAALAVAGFAQCPTPDLLDCGPCCAAAQANIPQLPAFQQPSLDICWRDCHIDNVLNVRLEMSKPVAPATPLGVSCGIYNTKVRLRNSAGAVAWSGSMRLTYSRTWLEASPLANFQVWRFLMNGDLTPTAAAGGTPCPVPPCAPAFANRVRFTGYVDYAFDCNAGNFQFAWMLSHVCDAIDHAPGFPRAGAFHPDRSYTFVGPAAGFVPGALQPAEGGGGPFEDVRRLVYPAPGTIGPVTCEFEERVQHQLQPLQQYCQCSSIANPPPQFQLSNLFIGGACGTNVNSGGPFLPGFISMGLGMWTDPTIYPGQEFLRWNAGGYNYFEPCAAVGRQEVFFGVTTLQGNQAFQVLCGGAGPALPLTFIDQANSMRSGNTVMNVPYTSDHIINLNH